MDIAMIVTATLCVVMSGVSRIKSYKKNNIKEWVDYRLDSIYFLLLAIWILEKY